MGRFLAIGAAAVALAYFLDPENGRRRREVMRAWLLVTAHRIRERVAAPEEPPVEARVAPAWEAPPPVVEEPPFVEERPTLAEERPSVVEELPTLVEERPSVVEDRSSVVEERPPPRVRPAREPVAAAVATAPEAETETETEAVEIRQPVAVAERPVGEAALPPPLPPDVLEAPEPEWRVAEPETPAPKPRKRRRWLFGTGVLIAALAAAGVAAFAFDVVEFSDDDEATTSPPASLAALADRQARAISIMAQPGATRIPVFGAEERVLLMVGVEGDAVLVVSRLDRAPAGKTYEIWVISKNVPKPAGLFLGGRDTVVPLSRSVPKGATVALTLERLGGAPRPTSKPIFAVTRS